MAFVIIKKKTNKYPCHCLRQPVLDGQSWVPQVQVRAAFIAAIATTQKLKRNCPVSGGRSHIERILYN
jgi:hypothetical protein